MRRQLRVSHSVLNILLPEIELNRAGVLIGVGQVEADGMAEHVRMDLVFDAGRPARGLGLSTTPGPMVSPCVFAAFVDQIGVRSRRYITTFPSFWTTSRLPGLFAVLEDQTRCLPAS